jgi:hypothetical protein
MKTFKKDDYIVVLFDDSSHENWQGYCLKQINNSNSIHPILTPNGKDGNNYTYWQNDNSWWRHATPAEITEYDRLDRPFNVVKFNEKQQQDMFPIF